MNGTKTALYRHYNIEGKEEKRNKVVAKIQKLKDAIASNK